MARFCGKCGSAVSEGAKFCRACGTVLPQNVSPRQPAQSYVQSPLQQPQQIQQFQQPVQMQAPAATPAKKNKGKGVIIAAVVTSGVVVLVAGIVTVCVLGFREGGWFRRKGNTQEQYNAAEVQNITENVVSGYSDTATEAMLDYAKRLEEMGNYEAAAEIYARIQVAGQSDMKEAVQDYRDDPRRLLLDAFSDEDLYDALTD